MEIVKLKEHDICVILYLLHHSDYGYSIARQFERAIRWWNGPKALQHTEKLYPILNRLCTENALIKKESHRKTGRRKCDTRDINYEDSTQRRKFLYAVNPSLFSRFITPLGILTEYLDEGYVFWFMKFLDYTSPNKQKCIKRINEIEEYNIRSMLKYIKNVVGEVSKTIKNMKLDVRSKKISKKEINEAKKIGLVGDFFDVNRIMRGLYFMKKEAEVRNLPSPLTVFPTLSGFLARCIDDLSENKDEYELVRSPKR